MTVEIKGEKYFNLFWHSDEHNLHPHTPTTHILSNITKMRNELGPEKIDLEFWGGDLCHSSTQTSDPDYVYLQHWVKKYLQDCHERKITVRILAGTFSHDRNQPEMFEILKPKNSPYIKYVDTLSIEYIPEYDIHVMYVPDNFGRKPKSEIYSEALELIASHGLKQVDFILLHGMFDFQLPLFESNKHEFYDSKAWSVLAKKIILTGHIHKPSQKYNIYSSGSFDRIAHGEMHAKGAYQVFFNKDKVICNFIENKNAMIYDTIQITPETTGKEIHTLLSNYLEKPLMNGANIRVKGGIGDIVRPIVDLYSEKFPRYNFETDNVSDKGVSIDDSLYVPERYKKVVLDETNLTEYTIDFIKRVKKPSGDFDYDYVAELMAELQSDGR